MNPYSPDNLQSLRTLLRGVFDDLNVLFEETFGTPAIRFDVSILPAKGRMSTDNLAAPLFTVHRVWDVDGGLYDRNDLLSAGMDERSLLSVIDLAVAYLDVRKVEDLYLSPDDIERYAPRDPVMDSMKTFLNRTFRDSGMWERAARFGAEGGNKARAFEAPSAPAAPAFVKGRVDVKHFGPDDVPDNSSRALERRSVLPIVLQVTTEHGRPDKWDLDWDDIGFAPMRVVEVDTAPTGDRRTFLVEMHGKHEGARDWNWSLRLDDDVRVVPEGCTIDDTPSALDDRQKRRAAKTLMQLLGLSRAKAFSIAGAQEDYADRDDAFFIDDVLFAYRFGLSPANLVAPLLVSMGVNVRSAGPEVTLHEGGVALVVAEGRWGAARWQRGVGGVSLVETGLTRDHPDVLTVARRLAALWNERAV